METKITSNTSIVAENFTCIKCDFKCCKKGDWTRHLATTKHKKHNNVTASDEELHQKTSNHTCINCLKNYTSRNGLWLHKKKCKQFEEVNPQMSDAGISGAGISDASSNIIQLLIKENSEIKNIILEIVKGNTDIQKQMLDVCKNSNSVVNTNSHNTTNNKIFNLQVFLNEECKDAMNMSDFINSIEVKNSDLENIGKKGYVEGVSNIIIKHLNDTDMYKRPVHCSDAKRETLYVKEENKWEKETQETKQMLTAVRGVNKKNYQMLNKWKETHPKCTDSKSTQCDDYMKIMSKVMDGDIENINKVIKKVVKEVVIEKEK